MTSTFSSFTAKRLNREENPSTRGYRVGRADPSRQSLWRFARRRLDETVAENQQLFQAPVGDGVTRESFRQTRYELRIHTQRDLDEIRGLSCTLLLANLIDHFKVLRSSRIRSDKVAIRVISRVGNHNKLGRTSRQGQSFPRRGVSRSRCLLQLSIERGNRIEIFRERCKADGEACFSSPLEKHARTQPDQRRALQLGQRSSIVAETEDSRRKHGQEEQQVEAGYHRSTHQRHVL